MGIRLLGFLSVLLFLVSTKAHAQPPHWVISSHNPSDWTATLRTFCDTENNCLHGVPQDALSVPREIAFHDRFNPVASVEVELNYPVGRYATHVRLEKRFLERVPSEHATEKSLERFEQRRLMFLTNAASVAAEISRMFEQAPQERLPYIEIIYGDSTYACKRLEENDAPMLLCVMPAFSAARQNWGEVMKKISAEILRESRKKS